MPRSGPKYSVESTSWRGLSVVTSVGRTYHPSLRSQVPPAITSVRPRWVKSFEADPFNPSRARGELPPLQYFVPIRDQTFGPREEPKPHAVSVFMPDQANFDLKFKQDQFLIYSVGSDGAKNFASKVQNTSSRVLGADYLIWPPIKSLYRQYLMDKGQLK